MLCPEILSQLDFGICAVAHDSPLKDDGQTDRPATDAHQKQWIADRCDYHHTHFDAFNELFIAYYEHVAMLNANMIPDDDDDEEGSVDREGMEEDRDADQDETAAHLSGACMWCDLTAA